MTDNVLPMRPRDQVPRYRIESFRSIPTDDLCSAPIPLTIRGDVSTAKLLNALKSVGLTFQLDTRTNSVVLMPLGEAPDGGQEQ